MKKIINHLKENWIKYGFETFVIIVGILGAFTLNNWNEDRNQRNREIQLLSELELALDGMGNHFNANLEASNQSQISMQVVINLIEAEIEWHDTLQQHFTRFLFHNLYTFDLAAYNSIENWGINNLSNDSIRSQIITLFQNSRPYLDVLFQQEYELRWLELRKTTKLDAGDISNLYPVDYDAFIKNKDLVLDLKWAKASTTFNNQVRQRVLDRITDLRQNINAEIARLNE